MEGKQGWEEDKQKGRWRPLYLADVSKFDRRFVVHEGHVLLVLLDGHSHLSPLVSLSRK